MPPKNEIIIVGKYEDLASPRIEAAFKKSEQSVDKFADAVERMQKSMSRSMLKSRKETTESLKGVSTALNQVTESHKKSGYEMVKQRGVTAGWRREIGALRNQLLLFFFVYRPLSKIFTITTQAFMRQQDAILRLSNSLRIQGTYTASTVEELTKLAAAFQKVTRYGDEAIMEVMQQLSSIGNVLPSQMKKVTQVTLDFAAATHRDLSSAALVVSKAMAGYTGELSRYGIIIDKSIPKSQRAKEVLEAMNRQFGGFAQRDIESVSGKVDKLKNSFGDLKEQIGANILANINFLAQLDLISDVIDKFKKITAPSKLSTNMQEINRQLNEIDKRLPSLEDKLEKQYKFQRLLFIPPDKNLINLVENLRMKKVELNLLSKKELEFLRNSYEVEKSREVELEKKQVIENKRISEADQYSKVNLQFQQNFAQQAAQSWEDLFFNVLTLKFRELEDVVVQFGNTVLRMLIKAGIQKFFISRGWGELIGYASSGGGADIGGHSGLYLRHGMSASSGFSPKKYHGGGEVNATLLEGEGVLSRTGMNKLGVNNLNRLNRGEEVSGGQIINNYYIQTIDERSFRERLEQNGDIYAQATSSGIINNRGVRRTIQRYGS